MLDELSWTPPAPPYEGGELGVRIRLNDVGEAAFGAVEVEEADEKEQQHQAGRNGEAAPFERLAEQGRTEAADHADHGVDGVPEAILFGDDRERVRHRAGEHPELDQKSHHVAEVTVGDDQG